MDPNDLAGTGVVDDLGNTAPENPPAAAPAAPATPEPSVAEVVAAELGKVFEPMNQRFQSIEEKLSAANPPQPEAPPAAWQPKTWDDFPSLVEQKGEEVARRILKERDDAVQAANDEAARSQQQIDAHIDGQVTQLEKSGALPAIKDVNAADDPGKLARQELFGFAAHLGTPNLATAHATLEALHAAGQNFDHKAGRILQGPKPNPGKTVPIGSSSSSTGTPTSDRPSYKDITTLSAEQLREKYPNG